MILAPLALLLAATPAPAAAEARAAYDLTCAASEEHAELRGRLADNLMDDPTVAAGGIREAFGAAMQPCLEMQAVSEDVKADFLRASLAVMLMAEFEARIRATGFDFAAVGALVAARRANPDLDLDFDFDAQIETSPEFDRAQIAEIEAEHALEPGDMVEMIGTYVGLARQLDQANAALGTR